MFRRTVKFASALIAFIIHLPNYIAGLALVLFNAGMAGAVTGGLVYVLVNLLNERLHLNWPVILIAALWGAAAALFALVRGVHAAVTRGEWGE